MSFLYPQVWEPGASVWDVVAIQNNMLALISNNHPQPYKKNILNIIIENEKEEMIELKSYFQEMERQFLKEVGCNTMEEFLKKVEEWNSSGAVTMMQNKKLIEDIHQIFVETVQGDLEQALNELTKENMGLTEEELVAIFGNDKNLGDLVSLAGITASSGGRTSSRTINIKGPNGTNIEKTIAGTFYLSFDGQAAGTTKREVSKGGLDRVIVGTKTTVYSTKGITVIRNKNGELRINFTSDMPAASRNNLIKVIKEKVNKVNPAVVWKAQHEVREKIRQRIMEFLGPIELTSPKVTDAINLVMTDFLVGTDAIAVNRSAASIRGMLGEVYWNAFFQNFGVPYRPVGANILTSTGKQLPIDIAVGAFGFQVKNYSKGADGIIRLNAHMDRNVEDALQKWLPNRVNLETFLSSPRYLNTDPTPAKNFYFSWAYNQHRKEWDRADVYGRVYGRFASIDQSFKNYAERSVATLMNAATDVQAGDMSLLDPMIDVSRPVFFLFNDQPMPTSVIIDSILSALSEKEQDVAEIQIKEFRVVTNTHVGGTWPFNPHTDPDAQFNNCYVEYYVEINLDALIARLNSIYGIKAA